MLEEDENDLKATIDAERRRYIEQRLGTPAGRLPPAGPRVATPACSEEQDDEEVEAVAMFTEAKAVIPDAPSIEELRKQVESERQAFIHGRFLASAA